MSHSSDFSQGRFNYQNYLYRNYKEVNTIKALEDLSIWLSIHYPYYTLKDVKPSNVKGYLKTTKPCTCNAPPFDGSYIGFPSGTSMPHYHTISIIGFRKGYGRGIYAWWKAVVKELEMLDKENNIKNKE